MIPAECSDLLKNELFVEIMDNIDDIVVKQIGLHNISLSQTNSIKLSN